LNEKDLPKAFIFTIQEVKFYFVRTKTTPIFLSCFIFHFIEVFLALC